VEKISGDAHPRRALDFLVRIHKAHAQLRGQAAAKAGLPTPIMPTSTTGRSSRAITPASAPVAGGDAGALRFRKFLVPAPLPARL
jgi:hypothetical protein